MSEPIQTDISIIGAGPAGVTAALALAQNGIPCLLLDKQEFPREKICGDGLSGKVLSMLNRLDQGYVNALHESGQATGSHAARFYSPAGKMMELSFKPAGNMQPSGFVCKRVHFDKFLLDRALESPLIRFKGSFHADKITRKNDRVFIEDKARQCMIESKLVLFAAGADKKLIKQLDPSYPEKAEEGIGVRGYFEGVSGADELFAIEIHFLKELLPWYLWIFPFGDGSANVGLALPETLARKNPLSLKDLLFDLINRYPHLKTRFKTAKLNGKIEADRLPFYTGPVKFAGDNYMLLGDAARLIDPFTGEGIGNAMSSGWKSAAVAATCVKKSDFSLNTTSFYEKEIKEKLIPELETGLKLQQLARRESLLNLVIGKASKSEKTRQLIAEMLYDSTAKNQLSKFMFYIKLILGL